MKACYKGDILYFSCTLIFFSIQLKQSTFIHLFTYFHGQKIISIQLQSRNLSSPFAFAQRDLGILKYQKVKKTLTIFVIILS